MLSGHAVAVILAAYAAFVAGCSALLWVTGNVVAAIITAVMCGSIWLILVALCLWAASL